jgi:cation/acetate symporter
MNKEGAIAGMLTGIIFTALYILYFKPQLGGIGLPEDYLFGISPEGIGTIGMIINFIVSLIVSRLTKPTPEKIKALVESIRYPK